MSVINIGPDYSNLFTEEEVLLKMCSIVNDYELPDYVKKDVLRRLSDWILSNNGIKGDQTYISRQFKFIDTYKECSKDARSSSL